MSSIPAGQRRNGQVAGACDTVYGSDDLDAGLLLALPNRSMQGPGSARLPRPHHVLQLRRVQELLEACELAVPELQDMADLGVETLASCLVRARVTQFDDHRVARVMERLGVRGEAVPLRPELNEQVLRDGVPTYPWAAARLVGVPLGLAPLNACIERAEHGGNVAAIECVVGVPC